MNRDEANTVVVDVDLLCAVPTALIRGFYINRLFMLYKAANFYLAPESVAMAKKHAAYNLYQKGRLFESSPLFEKYNHPPRAVSDDFDYSTAGGDILKSMQLENEYIATHLQ